MEPIIPTSIGRLWRGTTWLMRMIDPEKMPAEPIPAIARPMINASEFGAAPHTTEPISNSNTAARYTNLAL